MDNTVLGVLIGGVIGIVSATIPSIINYFIHRGDLKEKRIEKFNSQKVEAYKKLLAFVNDMDSERTAKDFDFYYSEVLPYISDELSKLIDTYYLINFESKLYVSRNKNVDIKIAKSRNIYIINHQVRQEFQERRIPKKKDKSEYYF